MNPTDPHLLFGRLLRLVELGRQLQESPHSYGTGERFTSAEIMLIETVGDLDHPSVTAIARHMDVTKGAVSQGLKRLEKKGLVERSSDPANLSRHMVTLTARGREIRSAHHQWHAALDNGFLDYFHTIQGEQLRVIAEFLDRVEEFVSLCLKHET